eukprot:8520840-Lingulodinium_polyedra.AAC.1
MALRLPGSEVAADEAEAATLQPFVAPVAGGAVDEDVAREAAVGGLLEPVHLLRVRTPREASSLVRQREEAIGPEG